MSFSDSGSLGDPFIAGIENFLEVSVGDNALGNGATGSEDSGTKVRLMNHATDTSFTSLSLLVMAALRLCETSFRLLMTAFSMVRAFAEPCTMMQIPLAPRSGAPPYSW